MAAQNGRIQFVPNPGQRIIRPHGQNYRPITTAPTPQDLAQKCQNFLDTLVRLADNKGQEVGLKVRGLVNQLINNELQPEDFGALISSTVIGSRPQPGLVPFLQKSLPFLRKCRAISNGPTRSGTTAMPPSGYSGRLPGDGIRSVTSSSSNIILQQPTKSTSGNQPFIATVTSSGGGTHGNTLQIRPDLSHGHNYFRPAAPNTNPQTVYIQGPTSDSRWRSTIPSNTKVFPLPQSQISPHIVPKPNIAPAHRDDDGLEDINDVTSQTGININDEARYLTEDNSLSINQLPKAPSRPPVVTSTNLSSKINNAAKKYQLERPVSPKIAELISHACQNYLKDLIVKFGAVALHRSEILRQESRYEVESEVKKQHKFFQEIEVAELQRRKDAEHEILLKTAKSKSKYEDPDEQQRARKKIKQMQVDNADKIMTSQTNAAAIHALDDSGAPPSKKQRMLLQSNSSDNKSSKALSEARSRIGASVDDNPSGSLSTNSFNSNLNSISRNRWTPKCNVSLKDAVLVLEQEKTIDSSLLYSTLLQL